MLLSYDPITSQKAFCKGQPTEYHTLAQQEHCTGSVVLPQDLQDLQLVADAQYQTTYVLSEEV